MGNFASVAQTYRPLFDPSQLQGQLNAFLVWYLLAIGLCIWAIAALSTQNVDAISPAAVGWLMPLFTALVHLVVLVVSYQLVPGFVPYPVKPAALFVSFDLLTAVCFGLAIGGLAANSIALLMVTNGFLVLAYSAYCYKYVSLISDIRSGKRGDATGSLNS